MKRRGPRARLRTLASAAIVTVVGATTLAGCQLVESEAPPTPLTEIESCALGTEWSLDIAGLGDRVTTEYRRVGMGAESTTAEGTVTLNWTTDSEFIVTPNLTVTTTFSPQEDGRQTISIVTLSGSSEGVAYINGEFAIPRDWSYDGIIEDRDIRFGGETVEFEDTFYVPLSAMLIDDAYGLKVQCTPDSLVLTERNGSATFTFVPLDAVPAPEPEATDDPATPEETTE